MGARLVRDLVTNLAIKQMFTPTSKLIAHQFRNVWSTSVNVAANCLVIAETVGGIKKEQAFFAGLIHNIGALPLLMIVASDDVMFDDLTELDAIINALQGRVGALMLESWGFSDDLIEVVTECHNFSYIQKSESGLVSLVQVSMLQNDCADEESPDSWPLIPALSKPGLNANVNIMQIEENQIMLDNTRESLMI